MSALQHSVFNPGQRHLDTLHPKKEKMDSVPLRLELLNQPQVAPSRERRLESERNTPQAKKLDFAEHQPTCASGLIDGYQISGLGTSSGVVVSRTGNRVVRSC
jgi:hypothetical protein